MAAGNPFSDYLSSLYNPMSTFSDPLISRYGSSMNPAIPTYGMDPVLRRQMQMQGVDPTPPTDPVLSWYAAHGTGPYASPVSDSQQGYTQGTPGGAINYSSTLGDGTGGVYQWRDQIDTASSKTGVPAQVIAAIMQVESGGTNYTDPNVAGAVGLMQVLPKYHAARAEKYGYSVYDPQGNILAGADYLKENFDKAKKTYSGISDADAWNIAAAQYLGAWDWSSGKYSGAKDAFNTGGADYVKKFDAALSQFGGIPAGSSSSTSSTLPTNTSSSGSSVIDVAKKFLGDPYLYGGNSPYNPGAAPGTTGFDCSSLVQYSYRQLGIHLPRTAQQQYDATQRVSYNDLKPGDLVFFTGTYNAGTPVTHVGIYMGNGVMIDDQNAGVSYDNLSDPYWQQHLYGFGRVTS